MSSRITTETKHFNIFAMGIGNTTVYGEYLCEKLGLLAAQILEVGKIMRFWMFGLGNDPVCNLVKLARAGFNYAVASWEKDIPNRILDEGLMPWTCLGGYPHGEGGRLALGIDSQSYTWFDSGCPNDSRIRARQHEQYERAAESNVAGIYIDGARFASPASADSFKAFFTCFCPVCMEIAEGMGLNVGRMQSDVTRLYKKFVKNELMPYTVAHYQDEYPGLMDWVSFRNRSNAAYIGEIASIVKAAGKLFGGYLFTPSLARLVGQDYSMVGNFFDVLSPMVYRAYRAEGNAPACLNHEYAVICRIMAGGKDNGGTAEASVLFDVSLENKSGWKQVLDGVSREMVTGEILRGRDWLDRVGLSPRYVPILDTEDSDLEASIAGCAETGLEEIAFFMFKDETFDEKLWRTRWERWGKG